MRETRKLLALCFVGCASSSSGSLVSVAAVTTAPPISAPPPARALRVTDPTARAVEPEPAGNPPYMRGIHSVEFVRNTALHAQPRTDSELVGIVRKGTRAAVAQAVPADAACRTSDGADGRWIAIEPRGWTCETAVEPSTDEPTPAVDASLRDDEATQPIRGVYGVVRGAEVEAFASRQDALAQTNGRVLAGANTVRGSGIVNVDGRRFWRTTQGELIDEASIVQISPSQFKGVAIDDAATLPVWVRPYAAAVTRAAPSARSAVTGKLAPRTIVVIAETSDDGRFVRVGDGRWVARADVRIATLAAPPPGTGSEEKWFDVDRDEQVLVAYEGTRPVYATLVSTGKYQHETPTEIARIAAKLETAVMSSEKDSVYSVADVPWTMYYDRDFALHTSYWHDGFGSRRSHGCVNLAPRDARLLYRWSSPDVPPGWIAVYGSVDHPGSLVRVRSRSVPEPVFRGYARVLHDRSSDLAAR